MGINQNSTSEIKWGNQCSPSLRLNVRMILRSKTKGKDNNFELKRIAGRI